MSEGAGGAQFHLLLTIAVGSAMPLGNSSNLLIEWKVPYLLPSRKIMYLSSQLQVRKQDATALNGDSFT